MPGSDDSTNDAQTGFSPEQLQALTALMQQFMTNSAGSGTTAPPSQAPPPPLVIPSGAPVTANPAAGASVSLLSLFPQVEAATITAIIQHELRPHDIYKLDSRFRDKADDRVLSVADGLIRLGSDESSAMKHYKAFTALLCPLTTYFDVLIQHAGATGQAATIAHVTSCYTAQLARFAAEYEWAAVLAYHMEFHTLRRREMTLGSYDGWRLIDQELLSRHLVGRSRKTASVSAAHGGSGSGKRSGTGSDAPCRNFNLGKCDTTPCKWGRPHVCSTCSKPDHGAHKHPLG